MLDWWERTDRQALARDARGLMPGGGLLVVAGDDESGRSQAASVVASLAAGLGYPVSRLRDTASVSPLEATLYALARELESPSSPGALSGAVGATRNGAHALARRVRTELDGDFRVIVLEDVDYHGPLSSGDVLALRSLARDACVVVTSREESGSQWGSAKGQTMHVLTPFARMDLLNAMVGAPGLADRPYEDLVGTADLLINNAPSGKVMPVDAYSMFRSLAP